MWAFIISFSGSGDHGFGLGQAQLAGNQAGEQGVAKGGEGLGLQFIVSHTPD